MGVSNTHEVSVRVTTTFVGSTQHNLYFINGPKLFKDVLSFHRVSHLREKWVFRCTHTTRKRDRDRKQMCCTILCGNVYYTLKERSHVTKFSPIFSPVISFRYSVNFLDPFAPKFYSSIQNNIGQNFGEGLNFTTCEHSLSGLVQRSIVPPLFCVLVAVPLSVNTPLQQVRLYTTTKEHYI